MRGRFILAIISLLLCAPAGACGSSTVASGPLHIRDMAGDDGRLRVLISGVGKQYLVQCERAGVGASLENCRSVNITYDDGGR